MDAIGTSSGKTQLRPHERVTQFLLHELERPDIKQGSRLPSNRELAQHLKVSVPTVQSVIQKLIREGRIQAQRGSGTFLASGARGDALKIVIAGYLRPMKEGDLWLHTVFAGLTPAVLRSPRPITLVGLSGQESDEKARMQYLRNEMPTADGLILVSYSLSTENRNRIIDLYEAAGKPVVNLHPPTLGATANFVSADYMDICRRLGSAWRETGRRRIVLLSPYFDFSVAAQLEHLGLASGLGKELGDGISLKVLANQKGGEASAYETVRAVLSQKGPLPDALYTLNDSCALGAIRAIEEAGLRIPHDISIAAGSGFDLSGTSAPNLTRSAQPLLQIGETLVEMILDRIERKGASVAGKFLSAPFTGGATTRPEENALLIPGH